MMDNIRSTANNPFIKILLAVIILSFVLTGVGGYLFSSGVNDAAEVNGYKISRAQLEQAYQQRRAQLQKTWVTILLPSHHQMRDKNDPPTSIECAD